MSHTCPYCNQSFSSTFIASTYETLTEITNIFYEDTPCCCREMECYLNNDEVAFAGRTMKQAEEELDESTYYPDGRKEPIDGFKEDDSKTPYSELLRDHNGLKETISYASLLLTREWDTKRKEIIKRDNKRCTNCFKSETNYYPYNNFSFAAKSWTGHFWIENDFGLKQYKGYETGGCELMDETGFMDTRAIIIADKQYYLQVHHNHYIVDRLPWEYKDDDLITLCNWCHWEYHQNNEVKVYQEINKSLQPITYTICSRCHGAGWFPEYTHVQGGVCFGCGGSPYKVLY